MPPKDKKDFYGVECKMTEKDEDVLKMKKISNDLEAYSYDMRSNLEQYGSYANYVDPSAKDELIKRITETIDWIYDENKP